MSIDDLRLSEDHPPDVLRIAAPFLRKPSEFRLVYDYQAVDSERFSHDAFGPRIGASPPRARPIDSVPGRLPDAASLNTFEIPLEYPRLYGRAKHAFYTLLVYAGMHRGLGFGKRVRAGTNPEIWTSCRRVPHSTADRPSPSGENPGWATAATFGGTQDTLSISHRCTSVPNSTQRRVHSIQLSRKKMARMFADQRMLI